APFLQFRLDRLLAAADLRTLEGRARAGEAAAAIVASHPNELVRDQYVMKVAGTLEIDADRVRAVVRAGPCREAPRARGPIGGGAETARARGTPVDRSELDVLRWAIHHPVLVADWLYESLFVDPTARSAFKLLTVTATFHEALDASEGQTRELLQRLAGEGPGVTEDGDEPRALQGRFMAKKSRPGAPRG